MHELPYMMVYIPIVRAERFQARSSLHTWWQERNLKTHILKIGSTVRYCT